MEKRFLFIRHGETDWNQQQKIQGHTDIELNDNGRKSAAEVSHVVKKYPVSHVYVSPLKRAQETAQIIVNNLHPVGLTTLDNLKERGWGDLEGRNWQEMQIYFDKEHTDPHYDIGFNVEPYVAFGHRIKQSLEHILKEETLPLIVSHGGVFKNLIKHLGFTKVESVSNTKLVDFVYKNGNWEMTNIDL